MMAMTKDEVMLIEYGFRCNTAKKLEQKAMDDDNPSLAMMYTAQRKKSEENYFDYFEKLNAKQLERGYLEYLQNDGRPVLDDDIADCFGTDEYRSYCWEKCLSSIYN